jgi:hypothetical protein
MNKIVTYLFSCIFLLSVWQVNAQSPVTVLSGTSLPADQGWSELKLDASINSAAAPTTVFSKNGLLRLVSYNAVDQFSQLAWYRTDLDLDLNTGFTIEIKARINGSFKPAAFNIQGYDNEGKGFRIGLTKQAITNQPDPFLPTTVVSDIWDNSYGFHIFTFTFSPNGLVTAYRDGDYAGQFEVSTFQYDNIIENGGFEDEEVPDFLSAGKLYRISTSDDPHKVRYGNYALEMNNTSLVTDGWTNPELARTREIAVKPDTVYQISITRRRSKSEPYAWRDMGAFYDYHDGTLGLKGNKRDGRDDAGRPMFASVNDRDWQVHNQEIRTPVDAKTIRFEFPSWMRDGVHSLITSAFDNFTFREKPMKSIVPTIPTVSFDPQVPYHAGYVNLIQNGGFEDFTINNDGTPYTWELSKGDNANEPCADNPMWGNNVRIQCNNKADDFNEGDEPYAHSGTASLRFSTLDNNSKNIDFKVELQPNKTYRFSFWHRNPKWNDWGWLFVRIGESEPIWGHRMGDRFNKWVPVDLVFTTTATDHTLHLYTSSETHGGWFNQYFDDFVLYEIPAGTPLDPALEGKTNLIANGDFEDVTLNNDGTPYQWAVASDPAYSHATQTNGSAFDDDFPMAYNPVWGTYLRIQDQRKYTHTDVWGDRDDNGYDWAHSGTKAIRFTYQDDWGHGQTFEGVSDDVQPIPYRLNMNFKKELEPFKTYTFVFWIKTSCWNDRGWFYVANGDVKVLAQELSNKSANWTRQQVTFSTTASNHTLRMFTEFSGWENFYLDDLFLYEEPTYVPANYNGVSYLQFGKSTGTSSTDVEIEYIKVDNTGAYRPTAIQAPQIADIKVSSENKILTVDVNTPSFVTIYSITGKSVGSIKTENRATFSLPVGVYIVKSVAGSGEVNVVKAINK